MQSVNSISFHTLALAKFVNKEVKNLSKMLIKLVREKQKFPHLGGGFTSQYALVGWGFVKICNDSKSNPHLGPRGRGGQLVFQLISALLTYDCSH